MSQSDTTRHPVAVIVSSTPIINDLTATLISIHKQFLNSPSFPVQLVPGLTYASQQEVVVTPQPATPVSPPAGDANPTPPKVKPVAPPRTAASLANSSGSTSAPVSPTVDRAATAQKTTVIPSAGNVTVKEGWLTKKQKSKNSWSKKYFVCTKLTLSYYKSPKENKPKEIINLKECSVGFTSIRPHCLVINTTISKKMYFICGSTRQEADAWNKVLTTHINQLAPIPTPTPSITTSTSLAAPDVKQTPPQQETEEEQSQEYEEAWENSEYQDYYSSEKVVWLETEVNDLRDKLEAETNARLALEEKLAALVSKVELLEAQQQSS